MITLINENYLDTKINLNNKIINYKNKISYKKIILSIHSLQNIKLILNNNIFNISNRFINILYDIKEDENLEIKISCMYGLDINLQNIKYLYIQEYSNPEMISTEPYQFVYSFDYNYYQGAFSSINSLIKNLSNNDLVYKINISLLIPKNEYDIIVRKLNNFIMLTKIDCKFSFYIVDDNFMDIEIKKTKCFKGSGHLLKLSNYSRLIIGHIINTDKLLYLDSDTIICSDLTKILDKTDNNFVIKGKKSNLNYYNLFNSNNIKFFNKDNFVFNKNVIYTGTLLINPINYKKYFNNMLEIVKLHNEILHLGGLYKLFTMSIINIALYDKIEYFDDILSNVVDLGYNKSIDYNTINKADVLDWSGVYKPWFTNGLYQEYWKKYNVLYKITNTVSQNKNSVENM